ncbi:MAG: response regulator [Gammaproteobacteria bacterium]|nr:response regulator [Gammaproteobacteria bacterium]
MTKLILTAEDNPINLELLVMILESNGFDVLTAVNGQEAVELTKSRRPDLVIMDIQMPVLDGYGAIKQIRESVSTRSIPVIAVSGNAMHHDIAKIKALGFDHIVSKPFEIVTLLATVNKVLSS